MAVDPADWSPFASPRRRQRVTDAGDQRVGTGEERRINPDHPPPGSLEPPDPIDVDRELATVGAVVVAFVFDDDALVSPDEVAMGDDPAGLILDGTVHFRFPDAA